MGGEGGGLLIALDELCELNELDLDEALRDLNAKGVWIFDAGSNGKSDLVYVTLCDPYAA